MSLWLGDKPLILASQSKSRQALLKSAGIPFDAIPADIDERGIQAGSGLKDPGAIAALLAKSKALHVASREAGRVVVGADQTLALLAACRREHCLVCQPPAPTDRPWTGD